MPADIVPTRYLVNAGGDHAEALKRWGRTHAWRKSMRIDEGASEDWPNFERFKKEYRHIFYGRAKNGHPVYYDRLDFNHMSKMVDTFGAEDLIRYYIFHNDFAYQELEPEDPGGRLVTIYDLSHFTLSSLLGSATEPVREIIRIYAAHYPERVDKVFLVNAPYFFTGIWASLRPFLDPRVVDLIHISTHGRKELLDHVGAENVPIEYGGTNPTPLSESPDEELLRRRIARNRAANAEAKRRAEAAASEAASGGGQSLRGGANGGSGSSGDESESSSGEGFNGAKSLVSARRYAGRALTSLRRNALRAIVGSSVTRATLVALVALWAYSFLSS